MCRKQQQCLNGSFEHTRYYVSTRAQQKRRREIAGFLVDLIDPIRYHTYSRRWRSERRFDIFSIRYRIRSQSDGLHSEVARTVSELPP
jgi:plasmid stabilization system protein ParE